MLAEHHTNTVYKYDKRYQKLVHTFYRVSVAIRFVTSGQVGEAWQSLKEIEFNKSSFWTLPSLNPSTDFHVSYNVKLLSYYAKMFI